MTYFFVRRSAASTIHLFFILCTLNISIGMPVYATNLGGNNPGERRLIPYDSGNDPTRPECNPVLYFFFYFDLNEAERHPLFRRPNAIPTCPLGDNLLRIIASFLNGRDLEPFATATTLNPQHRLVRMFLLNYVQTTCLQDNLRCKYIWGRSRRIARRIEGISGGWIYEQWPIINRCLQVLLRRLGNQFVCWLRLSDLERLRLTNRRWHYMISHLPMWLNRPTLLGLINNRIDYNRYIGVDIEQDIFGGSPPNQPERISRFHGHILAEFMRITVSAYEISLNRINSEFSFYLRSYSTNYRSPVLDDEQQEYFRYGPRFSIRRDNNIEGHPTFSLLKAPMPNNLNNQQDVPVLSNEPLNAILHHIVNDVHGRRRHTPLINDVHRRQSYTPRVNDVHRRRRRQSYTPHPLFLLYLIYSTFYYIGDSGIK